MEEIERNIIDRYIPHKTSLREVAAKCGTNHHMVRRVLTKNNIEIHKGKRPPFTKEHKEKISLTSKGRPGWNKGMKMSKESLHKNMVAHIRFDIDYEWISKYDDIEMLKVLNGCISNREGRYDVSTEWYKHYIETFYNEPNFVAIYKRWVDSNKQNKWLKPTIDHIIPISKGGDNRIINLQFLTWFENRCKCDIDQNEWVELKQNIHEYFI